MSYPNLARFPKNDNARSRMGRMLGHPARLAILRLAGPELVSFPALQEALSVNPRSLSRHLQFLVQRNYLVPIQEGSRTWYGVDEKRLLGELRRMQRFFREMRGLIEKGKKSNIT